MFSETGMIQEVLALVVAAGALFYLVHKLGGWPARKRSAAPPVVVGDRLARALEAANRRDESRPN